MLLKNSPVPLSSRQSPAPDHTSRVDARSDLRSEIPQTQSGLFRGRHVQYRKAQVPKSLRSRPSGRLPRAISARIAPVPPRHFLVQRVGASYPPQFWSATAKMPTAFSHWAPRLSFAPWATLVPFGHVHDDLIEVASVVGPWSVYKLEATLFSTTRTALRHNSGRSNLGA